MYTLHPITIDDVREFMAASASGGALGRLRNGEPRGPESAGLALAAFLAKRHPSFVFPEISLTSWEAQVDRGIGMLMRPPARLFVDAGLERALAQQFPIRLDRNASGMAGAYIPAHLISEAAALMETRLERHLRRLREAEFDPVANVGLMIEALAYAQERQTGLIEASGAVELLAPEARVFVADRTRLPKELRKRLEEAAKPPKKPGLIARVFGARPQSNGTDFERDPSASD